jgi:hypothetical protein
VWRHDEPARGEDDDGQVTADLVTVEGGLVVDVERHHLLAATAPDDPSATTSGSSPCGGSLAQVEGPVAVVGAHGASLARTAASGTGYSTRVSSITQLVSQVLPSSVEERLVPR